MYWHGLKLKTEKVLASFSDERGCLQALDFSKISFVPVRMFLISEVPDNMVRGKHGHFSTEQYLITVSGQLQLEIKDPEGLSQSQILEKGEGIHIPSKYWIKMTFMQSTQVLVLASAPYNQNDYFYEPITKDKRGIA